MPAQAAISRRLWKDSRLCAFGVGFRVLGFGFWVLGFGFWVLGFGFWVLGFLFQFSATRALIIRKALDPMRTAGFDVEHVESGAIGRECFLCQCQCRGLAEPSTIQCLDFAASFVIAVGLDHEEAGWCNVCQSRSRRHVTCVPVAEEPPIFCPSPFWPQSCLHLLQEFLPSERT
ncbi:unnamed protein product [Symbiodinium natans]|uniref:Uncharacterized protein n=1 Tax=Symbiodinium natans TaxID=878477 RepID=A0A812I394_9DINO|nr:unnamed protein product [Symbiodinium natans]